MFLKKPALIALLAVFIGICFVWEINNMTLPPKTAADRTRGDGRGGQIYKLRRLPTDTPKDSDTKARGLIEIFTSFAIWRCCGFLAAVSTLAVHFITSQSLTVSQFYMTFMTIYLVATSVVGYLRFHFYRPIQQEIFAHMDNITEVENPPKLLPFSRKVAEENPQENPQSAAAA